MTTPGVPGHFGTEPGLAIADFERISMIAKAGWGLNLDDAKKPLIRSRLGKRLRALGLSCFEDYCNLIETGDAAERSHFISALTTNVTHFYRELHHFEYLESRILPDLVSRTKEGHRARIWSAGCSSGKEPYSIAGSIVQVYPSALALDIKILATDVDSKVLSTAREGSYHPDDCSFPTDAHRLRIFDPSASSDSKWRVRSELQEMVSFRELNLMDEWPMTGTFDVIMCRNVAIYFDKATQNTLWKKFCRYLRPGGHLFIGHSERIANPETFGLTMCHTTTYQFSAT